MFSKIDLTKLSFSSQYYNIDTYAQTTKRVDWAKCQAKSLTIYFFYLHKEGDSINK